MKGRAAFKRALACEAGAWATVPVTMLPIPHWLYAPLDWGSDAVALGSIVTVIVIGLWNAFGPREQREPLAELLARPGDAAAEAAAATRLDAATLAAGIQSGAVSVHYGGPAASLRAQYRYLYPDGRAITTPPRGTRIPGHAVWVQGSPVMSSGQCGKCGEPMSRHVYYGRGECEVYCLGGGAHKPGGTPACGCGRHGRMVLCDLCGATSVKTLTAVRLPATGRMTYFCEKCAR